MDPMEEIKLVFFQECEELLADLESGLLEMQSGNNDSETINAVFRAVHSVKGGAGAFGMDELVKFAHVFETLLDEVRSDKIEATPDLVEILLRAADVLTDQVTAAKDGTEVDQEQTAEMVGILEHATDPDGGSATSSPDPAPEAKFEGAPAPVMVSLGDEPAAAKPAGDEFGFQVMTLEISAPPELPLGPVKWLITLTPKPELYKNGNEVALLLRELGRLGTFQPELQTDTLPRIDAMDPEQSYLSWELTLETDADEAEIREVFEFVETDCELDVKQIGGSPTEEAPATAAAPIELEDSAPIVVNVAEPTPAPEAKAEPAPEKPAAPEKSAAPAGKKTKEGGQAVTTASTIRVDSDRIDRLINLIGELVITKAMLAQRVTECGLPRTSNVMTGLDDLEQLTREIQEGVMSIRAQSVKSVFQRMPRLVRETVASTQNKSVRLITEGESTEVDKTVIERLSEPITHMLRNAIDHGLESREERIAAGKPEEGTVRLAALHRGGRIVIEVEDDGKGINREVVLKKAIEKQLVAEDAMLDNEEIDNLIFMPGFSTASQISDISGRGVGMDVVRRSVQALGGRIFITSRPGKGSTFTMSLPLTLAVLDGMVVDVAGHTLVLPLTAIVESLRPKPNEIRNLGPNGSVLSVRDQYVPIVDVGTVLGFRKDESTAESLCDGVIILVESENGGCAALAVDGIHGQRQVVIKSLETNYKQVDGIAAATVLGDGRVALIVDVDNVVAMRRANFSRSAETQNAAVG